MRRRAFPAIVGVTVALLVGIMVLLILMSARLLPGWGDSAAPADVPSLPVAQAPEAPESGASAGVGAAGVDLDAINTAWDTLAEVAEAGQWDAWARVVDADTGQTVFEANSDSGHTPASTMKILTSLFALSVLDPTETLDTGVSLDGDDLYLWGHGDLLLGAGESNSEVVNGRAGLKTLARRAASALKDQGISTVSLKYQASLFPGPLRPPGWVEQEVTEFGGDVAAFAIDTGRTEPLAWQFVDDSARGVANSFADSLAEQGISVSEIEEGTAPNGAKEIAEVTSASVLDQIEFMLLTSDNTVAEQYCHLASSQYLDTSASLADSTAALTQFLSDHAVSTEDVQIYDCSGLDSRNRVGAQTLTDAVATSAQIPGAASLVRFFPVGGVSGTLAGRFEEDEVQGNVSAKTGSLGAVATLSGIVTNDAGVTLIFAVGADDVPDDGAAWYRPDLDRFVAALAQS